MKIKRYKLEKMSIEKFAEKHNLIMEVHERDNKNLPFTCFGRFYAHFSNAEIKHGTCMLIGAFGNGNTEKEAIEDYAKEISNQILIIDAMKHTRKEIIVPILTK